MRFAKTVAGAAALGAAMVLGLSAAPAEAAYIVTLNQVGGNVVATGSGTLDLTGLSFAASPTFGAAIFPSDGLILTGPAGGELIDIYVGVTGPASFGSGSETTASGGSGDAVGIEGGSDLLAVPSGYVSGSPLSDTATYDGATFASLGATPGTYTWSWGAPPDDSFTLNIGTAAVPEPSSLALLTLPLGFLLLLAARRRAAQSA